MAQELVVEKHKEQERHLGEEVKQCAAKRRAERCNDEDSFVSCSTKGLQEFGRDCTPAGGCKPCLAAGREHPAEVQHGSPA